MKSIPSTIAEDIARNKRLSKWFLSDGFLEPSQMLCRTWRNATMRSHNTKRSVRAKKHSRTLHNRTHSEKINIHGTWSRGKMQDTRLTFPLQILTRYKINIRIARSIFPWWHWLKLDPARQGMKDPKKTKTDNTTATDNYCLSCKHATWNLDNLWRPILRYARTHMAI